MQNEPGSSSRVGQPIQVDEADHAVIPGDVEMQGEEFEVGANDENPSFFNVFQINPPMKILLNHSRPNPLSHDCHTHEDESPLNSLRETCARQSTSSFHPVPSGEAASAFSADSLEPACLSNKQWKKLVSK